MRYVPPRESLERLAALCDRRGARLVQVGDTLVLPAPVAAMATLRALPDGGTLLLVACADGSVVLCRVDEDGVTGLSSARMSGLAPEDQVIAVVRHPVVLSRGEEFRIIVARWEEDTPVPFAWGGLAERDGAWHLVPVAPVRTETAWQPVERVADALAPWASRYPLTLAENTAATSLTGSTSLGVDPPGEPRGSTRAAAWDGAWLARATAKGLVFLEREGAAPIRLEEGGVSTLALRPTGDDAPPALLLALGSGVIRWWQPAKPPLLPLDWEEPTLGAPVTALHVLTGSPGDRLLVAREDGSLAAHSVTDPARTEEDWEAARRAFLAEEALSSPGSWSAWLLPMVEQEDRFFRTATSLLAEHLLLEAPLPAEWLAMLRRREFDVLLRPLALALSALRERTRDTDAVDRLVDTLYGPLGGEFRITVDQLWPRGAASGGFVHRLHRSPIDVLFEDPDMEERTKAARMILGADRVPCVVSGPAGRPTGAQVLRTATAERLVVARGSGLSHAARAAGERRAFGPWEAWRPTDLAPISSLLPVRGPTRRDVLLDHGAGGLTHLRLEGEDLVTTKLQSAGETTYIGAALLTEGPDRLLIVSREGRRTSVELLEIAPDDRVEYALRRTPLPPGPHAVADARLHGERIVVATSRAHEPRIEVHRLRLSSAGETEWDDTTVLEIDSPASCLGFVPGDKSGALVVGTIGGFVWCLEPGSCRWCFRVPRRVRALDLAGGEHGWMAATTADPDDVILLDADGRRVWHRPTLPALREVLLCTTGVPLSVTVSNQGTIVAYVQPNGAIMEEAKHVLADAGAWPDVPDERRRRCERAMTDPSAGAVEGALAEATFRDVAAMARALGPTAGELQSPRWILLLEHLLVSKSARGADRSERARGAALAEVLRARPALSFEPGSLAVQLADAVNVSERDRWVCIEAARCWERALPTADDPDSAFAWLHLLPTEAARELVLAARDLPLGHALATWARAVEPGSDVTPAAFASVLEALEPLSSTPLIAALRAALRLAMAAEGTSVDGWARIIDFLRASRALLPRGDGPLEQVLGAARSLLTGVEPEDTDPLDVQARWLRQALGEMPTVVGHVFGPTLWDVGAQSLLRAVQRGWNAQVLKRLVEVAGTSRLRVREAIATVAGRRVELSMSLLPEGERTASTFEAELSVVGPDGDTLVAGFPVCEIRRPRLSPGDPEERIALDREGRELPPEIFVRLRQSAAGQPSAVTRWPVRVHHITPRVVAPVTVPVTHLDRLATRLRSVQTGVWIVSADPALPVDDLLVRVRGAAGTRTVALDELAKDLGPGRRCPQGLTTEALYRILCGRNPLEEATVDLDGGAELARIDGERLLLEPCDDAVSRLIDDRENEGKRVSNFLRRHQRAGRRPALLLVLPPALAARAHALIGPDFPLIELGVLLAQERVLMAQILARRWRVTETLAEHRLAQAAGDVRVLVRAEGPRPIPPDAVGIAQAAREALLEVASGLEARARLSIAALASATCEVNGATTGTHLIETREAEGAARRRQRRGPPRTTVYGWDGTPSGAAADVASLVGGTEAAVAHLKNAGLLRRLAAVTTIDPAVLRPIAIARAFGVGESELIALVAPKELVWEDLDVTELSRAHERALDLVRGQIPSSTVRALGDLWFALSRGRTAETDRLLLVTEQLTGLRPIATQAGGDPAEDALVRCLAPIGVPLRLEEGPGGAPAGWVLWTGQETMPADVASGLRAWSERPGKRPPLIVLGPSLARPSRLPGCALVETAALRRVFASERWSASFWAEVRVRTGLEALSPFVYTGALPPDHPTFVGRHDILADFDTHLRARNYLVLGGRQIGKTSLLNRMLAIARTKPDVLALRLELQGVPEPEGVAESLREEMRALAIPASIGQRPFALFEAVVRYAHEHHQLPIFFLNEIDGLLESRPNRPKGHDAFLHQLRGLSDSGKARFVMVGYTTVLPMLSDARSALFHMTTGSAERYYNVAQLADSDAQLLLDKLEQPPLGLAWASEADRDRGRRTLLRRSYRIPWVVQFLCAKLVEHLSAAQRGSIRLTDVREIAEQRQPVLEYLENIDFGLLLAGRQANDRDRALAWLILLATARARYFARSDTPDPREFQREDPGARAFTALEARTFTIEVIRALKLASIATQRATEALGAVQMERFLDSVALTVVLQALPDRDDTGARRWSFQYHLFPTEIRYDELRRGRSVTTRMHQAIRTITT